jgi:HNH endonuclease
MAYEHTCTECGAVIPCRRILKTLDERFWSKVRKGPDCWLWFGSCDPRGYGRLGKPYGADGVAYIPAHRLSWLLHYGPIPEGLGVLHRCDIRECVRPDHLFLGTNAVNMADKVAKGRQARGQTAVWTRFPELARAARQSQIAARKARLAPNATCKLCGVRFYVKPYRLSTVVACSRDHHNQWQRLRHSRAADNGSSLLSG